MERDIVFGYLFQPDASHRRRSGAEISLQQFFTQPDGFEYLGAAVRTDGTDAHLAHHLIQSLADSLDVVLFRGFIVHLDFVAFHQFVQYRKCHVRIEGTCPVSQKQGGMHHLAHLSAFYNQRGLYTFLHADKVMVHGTYGKQGRDGGVFRIDASIRQDDIVYAIIYRLFGFLAQLGQGFLQSCLPFADFEERRKLHGIEALIADVAENVQFGIGKDGMRKAHHLAMAFAGQEDVGAHRPDVFGERHHQFLAYRVDSRVGHLCELLAEIVE